MSEKEPVAEPESLDLGPDLECVRLLGTGKSARVFLAREPALGRLVAVKVLSREAGEVGRQRFEREARATAALSDPNVVGVYRVGRLPDRDPYLVMQYVRGRSLSDRLSAEGRLSPAEVRRVLVDAGRGLGAAHAKGVVHRDVRPENLLWEQEGGRVLVTDFGLAGLLETWNGQSAQLTRAGEVVGDARYASPEQLRGGAVTSAADIYSLGLVAIELWAGVSLPKSRVALMTERLKATTRVPEALAREDAHLASVLNRCLALEPAHRPDALTIVKELSGAGADRAPAGGAGESLPGLLRRKRMPQWVGGTAAAAWVTLELVNQVEQQNVLPDVSYPLALITAIAAVLFSIISSWFHGEPGAQRSPRVERLFMAVLAGVWVACIVAILLG